MGFADVGKCPAEPQAHGEVTHDHINEVQPEKDHLNNEHRQKMKVRTTINDWWVMLKETGIAWLATVAASTNNWLFALLCDLEVDHTMTVTPHVKK